MWQGRENVAEVLKGRFVDTKTGKPQGETGNVGL
jgi:hypothetical protein